MITLIIVDCQNDFITGTVTVDGAKLVVEEIKDFIKKHKKEIDRIIFTVNWHPYNHCSFKQFGGKFPRHCIQFTPGACIEPKLLKFVQSYNMNYEVSTRGEIEEVDQLGAFAEIEFVQDNLGKRYYFDSIVEADADTEFVICGIAGNQNVRNTISNLLSGGITPKIYMQGVAFIDDKKEFIQYIKNNGIDAI